MKTSTALKYSFSTGIALVLLYFAFRKVEFDSFFQKISEVHYGWVAVSIFMSLVSHWLRAYRWNLMLKPLGYLQLTVWRTFLAVMTGYLANLAFPRMGEVTRCGVMKRNDAVPMSISLGSVIAERVLDFFMLLSLLLLDVILEFHRVYDFFSHQLGWSEGKSPVVFITGLVGAVLLLGGMGVVVGKAILKREPRHAVLQKARRFLQDLIKGFLSIAQVKSPVGYIFSTLGIWGLYYAMSYVIFFSISETAHLGFGAGLSVLAASGVAMVIPVQGGIGAYHALVSGVLVLYGIHASSSLFFATLLHASQLLTVLLFGGLSGLITVFMPKRGSATNTER